MVDDDGLDNLTSKAIGVCMHARSIKRGKREEIVDGSRSKARMKMSGELINRF